MKTLALFLVPLVCATSGSTPAIDGLIESARAAPAEFGAEALIRLAALEQVEKPRRIELLEQAFEKASAAQVLYRRRAAIVRFGGPAGFFNRVYGQELDAMSLRLRAVAGLLPLDAPKAGALFQRIPPIRLPAASCAEFMVPDVSLFYEVLGRLLASRALTPKDLERFTGAIDSPAQIGPVSRAIAGATLDDSDFRRIVAALAGALPKVGGDDRSFTQYGAAGRQIETLAEECRRRKISPLALLEGYRLYLVIHLSASRCADSDLQAPLDASFGMATPEQADATAFDALNFFNSRLVLPPLQPIGEAEALPAKQEGTAAGLRSCEDAACRAIAAQFHSLFFNEASVPLQPKEKETPEWHAKLQVFLKAVADWKPDFREKYGLYNDLVAAVPNSADRETVLRALLDFTSRNAIQAKNRAEWFLPVNGLIGRTGLDPVGLASLIELLRKSDDPVIALFANLESVAPRTPDRVLPLL